MQQLKKKLRTCPWTTDNESPARFLATTEFRNLEAHLLRHKPSLRAPFKVSFLDRAFDFTTTQRLRTCPWTTDNESPARFLATTEFRNLEAHLLRRKPSLRAPLKVFLSRTRPSSLRLNYKPELPVDLILGQFLAKREFRKTRNSPLTPRDIATRAL